jgi:hypothetical protein
MRLAIGLITISVILLAVAILFDVNYIDYKSPIAYSEYSKINFYDFRGFRKPGERLNGVTEFAYIKTNRRVTFLNGRDLEIVTYFHPSRSYVFAHDIRNADLLRHELYHFHIAEYFSRLLRREIFMQKRDMTREEIDNLGVKFYKLEKEMQDEYDEESYHSYVMYEQRKWETRIDSLLLSLQPFSNPRVRTKNTD